MKEGPASEDRLSHLSDEAFVERAYALILHRLPDPEGLDHYVTRLRAGDRRARVWESLQSSLEHLDTMLPAAGVRTPASLAEVMSQDGSRFVHAAYMYVLGRPADAAGHRNYLRRLERGSQKLQLLHELRSSQEALAHPRSLSDLDEAVRQAKLSLSPKGLETLLRRAVVQWVRR